jgi:CheY-like chemotaxis protein
LAALQTTPFDCLVLDLALSDMSGVALLEAIRDTALARLVPVVVYTAKDLPKEEELRLKQLASSMPLKDVRSPQQLLDQTSLFLHRNLTRLPEAQRQLLQGLHQGVLVDKKVLLVDDDIRNIFAMTSILERFKMTVLSAENGRDAIQILVQNRDIDIVLMDIMLPTMDGYETTRAIREIADFRDLPIIAVTAKAMMGDREKCIAAGASDYLAKPIDSEHLRSLLRLWLHR